MPQNASSGTKNWNYNIVKGNKELGADRYNNIIIIILFDN